MAENKVTFTDNELKSIAVNAMGRSSEAGQLAISNLIKLFLVLLLGIQFANALDLSRYTSTPEKCASYSTQTWFKSELECLKSSNASLDDRLNRVYKQLMSSLSQDNKTALRQKQRDWLKQRDKLCKQYSNNQTKLTACYIEETMPKVIELSELDVKASIEIGKKNFEVVWEQCDNEPYCEPEYLEQQFLIQENDNICGHWNEYYAPHGLKKESGMALYRMEDSTRAISIKRCADYKYNTASCGDSDFKNDIYTYNDFSNWTSSVEMSLSLLEINKHQINRRPFKPNEREELIKNNKWLQDCLNYRGE